MLLFIPISDIILLCYYSRKKQKHNKDFHKNILTPVFINFFQCFNVPFGDHKFYVFILIPGLVNSEKNDFGNTSFILAQVTKESNLKGNGRHF